MRRLAKIFVLTVCFICGVAGVVALEKEIPDRHPVYMYLELWSRECFPKGSISLRSFNPTDCSYNRLLPLINECGRDIAHSVFSSRSKLQALLDQVESKYITPEMSRKVNILYSMNNNVYFSPLSKDIVDRAVLLAPGVDSLRNCVKKFKEIMGENDNYELNRDYPQYTLEDALFVIFFRKETNFSSLFTTEDDRLRYVRFFCGAVRKYLSEICQITVPVTPNTSSGYSILSTCYKYFNKIDTKKYD